MNSVQSRQWAGRVTAECPLYKAKAPPCFSYFDPPAKYFPSHNAGNIRTLKTDLKGKQLFVGSLLLNYFGLWVMPRQ